MGPNNEWSFAGRDRFTAIQLLSDTFADEFFGFFTSDRAYIKI